MKNLIQHIQEKLYHQQVDEKLVFNRHTKQKYDYHYHPQTRNELKKLVYKLIKERGDYVDLNDIDTSEITDMCYLFQYLNFNINISKWDVSNVKDMSFMFWDSTFNGDISNWDVSNVVDMHSMFGYSKFNGDISKWDVSNVKDMGNMFIYSTLEKNPPKWYKK